jgi:D-alanine-D-alanine ligase
MVIGLCFNVKRSLPSTDPKAQVDAEFDAPETISAIEKAIKKVGHEVIRIEANQFAPMKLYRLRKKINLLFNFAEGIYGDAREAQIPAICDLLQIPYSHSSTLTHAISLDKTVTKQILIHNKISTPRFQLFTSPDQKLIQKLKYPLITKPNSEGSSKGILNKNVVHTKEKLYERVKWLFKSFKQSVLVEEFLFGREFTVGLIGNPPRILPIIEQNMSILPKKYLPFSSYEVKWLWEDSLPNIEVAYTCPAKINSSLKQKIENICLKTWHALNCRDVIRIDIRLDEKGNPNVLELNTLPGMIPDEKVVTYLPIAARTAGINFDKLVEFILNAALKRYQLI